MMLYKRYGSKNWRNKAIEEDTLKSNDTENITVIVIDLS